MKVKDIMSKNLIIANYSINVYNLSKIMKDYNIGFVPIEKEKKIIGVITDRDIAINLISNQIPYNKSIEPYINNSVINIDSDSGIDDALNLMSKNKIKRLIATNKNKIVGIISISDILSSNYDDITNTLKIIWSIENKNINYKTEIDEFYL